MTTTTAINGEIRPDDWVLVGRGRSHNYLVGIVTKIIPQSSEGCDPAAFYYDNVHVDFTVTDYSVRRRNKIARDFGSLGLDDVILAPKNLIRLTGIDLDVLSGLLASRAKAKDYSKRVIDENDCFDGCVVGSFSTSPFGGELYVDTNDEGKIPHFHIRNHQVGEDNKLIDKYGFLTGIEFKRPAYCHQRDVKDVLNDEQKEALNEFFCTVVDRGRFRAGGVTIWDMCCTMWNWNNPDGEELPEDLEMPDYTKLPAAVERS